MPGKHRQRMGEFQRVAPLLLVSCWLFARAEASPLFLAPYLSYDVGGGPVSVGISDLNGDGRPDLAVANEHDSTVSVLLGKGDGTFGANTDFTAGSEPASVAVGDLNGDGRPDLAVANNTGNTVSVLLGIGDGTFGAKRDFVTGGTGIDAWQRAVHVK